MLPGGIYVLGVWASSYNDQFFNQKTKNNIALSLKKIKRFCKNVVDNPIACFFSHKFNIPTAFQYKDLVIRLIMLLDNVLEFR
jgi:hypothetical protein